MRQAGVALILIAIVAVLAAGCGAGRPDPVNVFPIPDSNVASPQTQIVFRGTPAKRIGHIVVTGSRSGVHRGRILPDSDGGGGSFIPAKPFLPGERVTVRTRLHLLTGRRSFSFTVATPAGTIPNVPLPVASRAPGDLLSFRSRPDLTPATVSITQRSSRASAGDIFLAPEHGPLQTGPMILDPSGALVWFHPLPAGNVAADFRVQDWKGNPVLTWWQGYMGAGVGVGEDVIYDASYRQLAVVRAANGLSADLHEFLLGPNGRALITAYYPVYWDASSVRGPAHAIVLDSVIQEIDVRTGLLLFQWDSLDHVPLAESYEPLPPDAGQPFDYFHINSIQRDSDGDLVVSARNTWAAYKINTHTGRVTWALGGKHSTFKLPREARFAFQHHVRVRAADDRIVTVFDDGAGPPVVHDESRGLTLKVNRRRRTVTLLKVDTHAPSLVTSYEGDVQQLANSNQFLGWGQQPYFTEFDPQGRIVFDGRFVGGNTSYRAYRFQWTGVPRTLPAITSTTTGHTTTVYASWNGATNVTKWQVLAGASPTALKVTATQAKRGFETELAIAKARYVAVRAIDPLGRVLATSPVVPSGQGHG